MHNLRKLDLRTQEILTELWQMEIYPALLKGDHVPIDFSYDVPRDKTDAELFGMAMNSAPEFYRKHCVSVEVGFDTKSMNYHLRIKKLRGFTSEISQQGLLPILQRQ